MPALPHTEPLPIHPNRAYSSPGASNGRCRRLLCGNALLWIAAWKASRLAPYSSALVSNVNNDDETFLNNSIDFLTHRFGNLSSSQSLFKFKKKFQPIWESRYLVYSHKLTLPQIGWALYAAHQQDASCLSVLCTSLRDWWANRQRAQARSEDLAGVVRTPVTGALSL